MSRELVALKIAEEIRSETIELLSEDAAEQAVRDCFSDTGRRCDSGSNRGNFTGPDTIEPGRVKVSSEYTSQVRFDRRAAQTWH